MGEFSKTDGSLKPSKARSCKSSIRCTLSYFSSRSRFAVSRLSSALLLAISNPSKIQRATEFSEILSEVPAVLLGVICCCDVAAAGKGNFDIVMAGGVVVAAVVLCRSEDRVEGIDLVLFNVRLVFKGVLYAVGRLVVIVGLDEDEEAPAEGVVGAASEAVDMCILLTGEEEVDGEGEGDCRSSTTLTLDRNTSS